jgi:hypothetical protein
MPVSVQTEKCSRMRRIRASLVQWLLAGECVAIFRREFVRADLAVRL